MNILLILMCVILLIYMNNNTVNTSKKENLSLNNVETANLFIILISVTLLVYIYDNSLSTNKTSLLNYLSKEQKEKFIIINIDTKRGKLFLKINIEFLDTLFNTLINLIKKIIYKNINKLDKNEIKNLLPIYISENSKNILRLMTIMIFKNDDINNEDINMLKIKLLLLLDKYINLKDLKDLEEIKKLLNNNLTNNINIINNVSNDIPEIFSKIIYDMSKNILDKIILIDKDGNMIENKNVNLKKNEFVKILDKYLPKIVNNFETSLNNSNISPSTTLKPDGVEKNNEYVIKVISNTNDPEGIKNGKYREVPNSKFFTPDSNNWNISIKFNLDKFNNKLQCIIGNMSNNLNNWGLWINPQRILQWKIDNSTKDLNDFGALKDNTLYMINLSYYNGNYNFSLKDLSSNNLIENFEIVSSQISFSAKTINTSSGSITFGGDFIQNNNDSKFLGSIYEIKSADIIETIKQQITTPRVTMSNKQTSTPRATSMDPAWVDIVIFNNLKKNFNIYQEINQESIKQESMR
jgi:hypothetical protein